MLRIALILSLSVTTARALEIRMRPDGPLSTLTQARDAVRQARAQGDLSYATVVVESGNYVLDQPLILEAQDSDLAFEAERGSSPTFSGGKRILGWKSEGGRWTAKVDPAWRFEALWINGKRATRARTPNSGFVQAISQPTEQLPNIAPTGDITRTMLRVEPDVAKSLDGLSPSERREVNVMVYFTWDVLRHRLHALDPNDGTLQFAGPLNRQFFSLAPFHPIVLENYRAALDSPGEWFLALDGTLSYLPTKDDSIDSLDARAPVSTQWISIHGGDSEHRVRNIRFHGLRFQHQGWNLPAGGAGFGQAEQALGAAVELDAAEDISFRECEFSHTLTNAVWARHDCHRIRLHQCFMHDLGAGGLKIGEPNVPKDPRSITDFVTVEDCIIHGGGRQFPGAVGVWVGQNPDNTIRHCDVADFFYSPVSIGWVWGYKPTPTARNLVENCHLHHYGWGIMSDMGAVYTLGPQPGTVIRGCRIHDTACMAYGAWGLYNDEGSTGVLMENNLVYRTQSGGYHQHYGRGNIVRNNIFADSYEVQWRWSRPEEFLGMALENNIVVFREGKLLGHVERNWLSGRVWTNRNVYWNSTGAPIDFAGKTWSEWQALGNDTESIIADPLFAAPEKDDWTLSTDSPALRLGFKPFDWRQAGVRGSEAWRQLANQPYPDVVYPERPKARPLTIRESFENTALGGRPERIAKVTQTIASLVKVVTRGSRGSERCLELTDGPSIQPQYQPHFYYSPHHQTGRTRVGFDVRLQPQYMLLHEWRDDAQPYHTGPQLRFENGKVMAGTRTLMDLPSNDTWLRVEVEAMLGADCPATWKCTLTPEGGQSHTFEDLPFVSKAMQKLDWAGWTSNGKAAAKAWLDEIRIDPDATQ